MRRAPLWIILGCLIALFGCKKSNLVQVEGDVIVDGVHVGLVDVEFIPAEQMNAALEKKPFTIDKRPTAAFSVKSEADGSFFLKMTPGKYAVFAHGSHKTETGDQLADAWLLWHTVRADDGEERPRLLLSGNNQLFLRCPDCIQFEVEQPKPQPPPPAAPTPQFGSVPAEMQLMGSLDRVLVEKVIKMNRGQARYCFESQLNQFPNLHGKVAVKFVISPTGAVATSSVVGSTAGNSMLEACLASRVKTWQFPKPKGGGVVVVTYPFVFTEAY